MDTDTDGIVSVISSSGELVGELIISKFPEITGLFIPSKKRENLYFTEKGSNGIMKIKLSTFISDLDKLEENNKNMNYK